MRSLYLIITFFIILSSCHRQNRFNDFYRAHKRDANLALSLPKWLVTIAIPKEEKEVIKRLSKGMGNVRLLIDENNNEAMTSDFKILTSLPEYKEYMYIKDDETRIHLFVREDDRDIREIVFSYQEDKDQVIIALNGRMSREYFEKQLADAMAIE